MPVSKLTDEEVLATFMEPRPTKKPMSGDRSVGGWWWWGRKYSGDGDAPEELFPIPLTLNECHEIEARLISGFPGLWDDYYHAFGTFHPSGLYWTAPDKQYKWALHADAPTKITALAQILRAVVEAKHAGK
jgi:hypothetical protein